MIKMASNIMFMCCLFCGVDLSTAVKYNKRKLLNFQDHFSLWKELACKYNQESSTSIDTDHEIDGSLMCRNCFRTCCSYFDERSKIYNKLKNAWSTKLSLIGTPQVSLGKRSRSGQGVAGELVWGPAPSLGEEGSGQTHIYSSCKRNAIIFLFTIVRPRTKSSELEWVCNRFTIIIIQPFLLPFEQHGVLPVSVSWPCGLSCNSWSHANHGLPRKLE